MKKMDAYIAIRGSNNITELADVPVERDETAREKIAPGPGPTCPKNKVGRAALAHPGDGATRRHEHGSV